MVEYIIRKATEEDFSEITALQDATHYTATTAKEKEQEGFVSVETELPFLRKINEDDGIYVVELDSKLVGYELPLTLDNCRQIPMLDPFVERILNLEYQGKKLSEYRIIIEGQINIAKAHKGKRLAEQLHSKFVNMLKGKYDLIVTEISDQNPRSLQVHVNKLGLSVIDKYRAEGINWSVLMQDIRKKE